MSNRTAEANRAIAEAWQREQELVRAGQGTRDWTPEQQQSILEFGKAYDENGKSFEGHHMKSVEQFPNDQGNAGNIQFLSRGEHLSAHNGSFQNSTNGCYDPMTGETSDFGNDPVEPCKVINLGDPVARAGRSNNSSSNNLTKSNTKGAGKMAGWQVTEQAIAAMNNMSAQLQELAAKIHSETEKMKSTFEENQDGLGAHSADIQALIEEVEGTEQDASIPVKKLVLKLQRAALIRQKHIETQRYSQGKGRSR